MKTSIMLDGISIVFVLVGSVLSLMLHNYVIALGSYLLGYMLLTIAFEFQKKDK